MPRPNISDETYELVMTVANKYSPIKIYKIDNALIVIMAQLNSKGVKK